MQNVIVRTVLLLGKIRAANSKFKIWCFLTSQISQWPFHNEQNCTKATLLWLSGRSELNLARIRGPHFLFASPNLQQKGTFSWDPYFNILLSTYILCQQPILNLTFHLVQLSQTKYLRDWRITQFFCRKSSASTRKPKLNCEIFLLEKSYILFWECTFDFVFWVEIVIEWVAKSQ